MKTIEGQLSATGIRFGLVAARFNSFVVEHLIGGAKDTLLRHGGEEQNLTLVRVPGSLEIPVAVRELCRAGNVDAIIALGAVIRGATSHYDLVCHEMSKGLSSLSLETGIPITFGVITAENLEQAIERAGSKAGNKGAEAALAAVEMVHVLKGIRG